MKKTFTQDFNGYWREPYKSGLPNASGIYCVYECTYNKEKETVSIHKLIYIGESEDVNHRVTNHEKLNDWLKHVKSGNVLCYNFTPVESSYRERVEAALIYYHKPPENIHYKYIFPFEKTIVRTNGSKALLERFFIINRKYIRPLQAKSLNDL